MNVIRQIGRIGRIQIPIRAKADAIHIDIRMGLEGNKLRTGLERKEVRMCVEEAARLKRKKKEQETKEASVRLCLLAWNRIKSIIQDRTLKRIENDGNMPATG